MPSDGEIAISVRNLTKSYRIFSHPGDRLRQAVSFGFRRFYKRFTALEDVSFDIKKGETVGIIGRNGSGKSTLLQLICGILKPSGGNVRVSGRVSALLELGAGFNAEFTGRENVYFHCALHGLTKEDVDERFGEIASFADIGDYIDQPVRTYSSGMFVRLAFATLIHVDADILVVDEALAVGDEAFQKKCLERLEDMFARKQMILFFVSHNIRQIRRMCSRAILLEKGQVRLDGPTSEVCAVYHRGSLTEIQSDRPAAKSETVVTSGSLEVHGISLSSSGDERDTNKVEARAAVKIRIRFGCMSALGSLLVVVGFDTRDGIRVGSGSSQVAKEILESEAGEYGVECFMPDMMLMPGEYSIRLAIYDSSSKCLWEGHRLHPFLVEQKKGFMAIPVENAGFVHMDFSWRVEPKMFDGRDAS